MAVVYIIVWAACLAPAVSSSAALTMGRRGAVCDFPIAGRHGPRWRPFPVFLALVRRLTEQGHPSLPGLS